MTESSGSVAYHGRISTSRRRWLMPNAPGASMDTNQSAWGGKRGGNSPRVLSVRRESAIWWMSLWP